jgi:hypothetical protein
MRMRWRSESIPDLFISCLGAQMSLSQKNEKHLLGKRKTWEEDPPIDARQSRPRPGDADLRRARLAQVRRSHPSGDQTHLRIRDTTG